MTNRPTVLPAVRTTLAASILLLLGLGWFSPASAHASLLSSDPADGARLDALPTEVSLEFSEPISAPAYVVVTAPDGTTASQGEVDVVDNRVSVATSGTAEGTYGLAFRVVSEDGHPVSGQLTFVVGDGPLGDAPSAATSEAASGDEESPAATAGGTGPTTSTPAPARGEPALSLVHIQVGIAVGLFAIAGALVWWSRRSDG